MMGSEWAVESFLEDRSGIIPRFQGIGRGFESPHLHH